MPVGEREKSAGLLPKILIFLAVIALIAIFFAISREMKLKSQVNGEIERLKQEAARIERENRSLEDKISYLESIDYKEKEARDKLSLKGKGENVVIIKPNPARDIQEQTDDNSDLETKIIIRRSNVEKWWDYFFKY